MIPRHWGWRVAYRVEGGEPDKIHGIRLCKSHLEAVAQARLILREAIRPVDAYQGWDRIECTWIERLDGDEWVRHDGDE